MTKQTIRDIDVAGKRVLVRVDFNVPLDAQQQITDDTRIKAALPTIRYLLERALPSFSCRIWAGQRGKSAETMRLAPVARRLSELLHDQYRWPLTAVGPQVTAMAEALRRDRFCCWKICASTKKRKRTIRTFARQLADLGEVYVNDAFGYRTSRPRFNGRRDALSAGRVRFPDGKGDQLPGCGAGTSQTSVCGHHRRSQSLRQDRRYRATA